MGCGGSKAVEYEFNKEKRTIPGDKVTTLKRWGDGAQARHTFKRMKMDIYKEITGKFPIRVC